MDASLAYPYLDDVCHDFRTPLTVIKEFTSFVRDGMDGPVNDRQRERLDVVAAEIDELASLIDDLYDINRLPSGVVLMRRTVCRIEDVIERVRTTLQRKVAAKGISLQLHVDDGLPPVYCDPDKTGRAIVNLVGQLVKMTRYQDQIALRVLPDPDEWQVIIRVENNAPGVKQEALETVRRQLLQADEPVRSPRLDLALAIAHQLVRLNLGDIRVEHAPDQGHGFSFTIPTADTAKVAARYLHRRRTLKPEQAGVCSIAVSIPAAVEPRLADEVDEFLQHTMRPTDLVFRIDGRTWLLVTDEDANVVDALIEQIAKARQKTNRHRPGEPLPRLFVAVKHQWNLGEGDCDIPANVNRQVSRNGSSGGCILLVDDDRHLVEAAAIRLRATGYDVITAYDGEKGLELASRRQPDAILLDIRMPDPDGLATLKRLRGAPATAHIPVVMMSASWNEKNSALDGGAQYFLPKPYDSTTLVGAIESLISCTILEKK